MFRSKNNFKAGRYCRIIIYCILVLFAGCILCGCEATQEKGFSLGKTPPRHLEPLCLVGGVSVENRKVNYHVLGTGDDVVFVLASIHGNEKAGTPVATALVEHLKENWDLLIGRKVIVMPVANPDGFANNSRGNANGIDLNRNFATFNRINNFTNGAHASSEPETRMLERLIDQYDPDRILTFHEALSCIDYDGPGEKLSQWMGQYCDLPVKKLGCRPGSMGSYAGETLGIPIVTIELTKADKKLSDDHLWRKYGQMTLAGITYPNTPDIKQTEIAKSD